MDDEYYGEEGDSDDERNPNDAIAFEELIRVLLHAGRDNTEFIKVLDIL